MLNPIVIVGCTASGKSDLAETLALKISQEAATPTTIMAVDSMQVYRGMDIGTAKPDAATRQKIPHVMIDVADPWESYSAARFTAEARPLLDDHLRQNKPILLIGGTILYLRALLEGLFEGPSADPVIRKSLEEEAAQFGVPALHARLAKVDPLAATRIHANDLRRIVRALEVFGLTGTPISGLQTQWSRDHPAITATFLGVHREKELLNRRINARVRQMIFPPDGGPTLIDEVRRLTQNPRGLSKEASGGVGYRQLLDHFAGKCSLDDAIEQIKISTRHLAKLQRTWLKRFTNVTWLDAGEQPAAELVEKAYALVK